MNRKNILTKPAVAHVEDLFVLLAPFEDKINDPKKIEEMLHSYKRKQLQEFEKFDKAEIYGESLEHTHTHSGDIHKKLPFVVVVCLLKRPKRKASPKRPRTPS